MLDSIRPLVAAAQGAALSVDPVRAAELVEAIAAAPRVFVAGAGRTGLAARAFVIRLRHLGKDAYAAGEAATPAPEARDLVLVCTASSETATTVAIGRGALARAIPVWVITQPERASAWPAAARVLALPVGAAAAAGPLGTVFELALGLLFDGLVAELMARLRVDEASMRARHATLE